MMIRDDTSNNQTSSHVGDERRRGLSVHISHVDCSPIQQTQYVIRVADFYTDAYERTVRRPYSEFRRFRFHILDLLKLCTDGDDLSQRVSKQIEALVFPPKRFFGARSEAVVRTRANALNKWITCVLAITTEYRKAQKNLAVCDPSASTQGSAILLDALKTFLTSRVEELQLINPLPLEKSQSLPMPPPVDMKGRGLPQRRTSSSHHNSHERSNNVESSTSTLQVTSTAPLVALPALTMNDINHIASSVIKSSSGRSILKSHDRLASSGSGMRKTKTRFSIAEPSETSFSNNCCTSNSSEGAHHHRSSSSSTAASSAEGSFSNLAKTELSARLKSTSSSNQSRHSMHHHNHRGSVVKDARFSMTQPKVIKRLPAGDESDIVIAAETELQSMGLSTDTAAMVLRYMDRFLVKATQRQPGCYRITPDNWLAIDAERLCTELEEALFNPAHMQAMLFSGGEWRIPQALEGYIQHKWAVHHNTAMDEQADDSDDDEPDDSHAETLTKSARKNPSLFSRHDIDEIEQLMSEGTASRSQVKQLRRQLDEGNWDRHATRRRAIPLMDNALSNSDDDNDNDSLGEEEDIDFATYARRKSGKTTTPKPRAPAFQDHGGLV
ncbi:hypothetical protein DYB37_005269 [Aphanomyces astaci]|uniref:PX domain-containing protein n=1 Tax=Aphanomyces astaci TaxID=112090 RepID=A0A3R7BFJ5_APHAT|nr:hypothetical protein DYB35_008548 [Aphanomyces astaci]RHZ27341.1 hypothetical protein DYB37_005269 [Aphanomyces astaci]